MMNWGQWLPGLSDPEEDDPVTKAIKALGQGASQAAGQVGEALGNVGSAIGSALPTPPAPTYEYPPVVQQSPPLSPPRVISPTAPSPFSPAGTPGVYAEPAGTTDVNQSSVGRLWQAATPANVGETLGAAGSAALQAGAAAADINDPVNRSMMAGPMFPAYAGKVVEATLPAFGGEVGRRVFETGAGPDHAPYATIPESVPIVGGKEIGPGEVGEFIGSSLTDPLSYIGVPAAARAGHLGRGVAEALPVVGDVMGAADLAKGAVGAARAVPSTVRAVPGAVRGAVGALRDTFASNAERVAAADARMAGQPAYSATLIVPEDSPVRTRRIAGAAPMDLSEAETPAFVHAADELSQGRMGPDSPEALDPSHPLEWHDVTVRINNKGQYDGDHPGISLPFFRNAAGDLIPLEPSDVGPMGSPVNSAYNAAVKAAGGRKGFVYGLWRDAGGQRHEFDSPQEVVAMVHLDALQQEGAINGWWSQANNPYPQLEKIPYASTNRDKGGLKFYKPDLIVRHNDGSLEVIEIKSPEVIAKAEEYGMKAGTVSGHMGWDVVKKAAGIMAGLADLNVKYRLMLPHEVLGTGRIPLGPNLAGQGNRTRRLDMLPGVDVRDQPKMRKKKITPAENSPGVPIAEEVARTSDALREYAAELKAQGVPDDERLRLLTGQARDRLLRTSELATSAPVPAAAVARGEPPAPTTPGRQEGQTRLLAAGGEAPLGSWVNHRGPLSLDDLDEMDPDTARILRETEQDRGTVTQLAIHDATGPDGAPRSRLVYEIDGDPQASVRAGSRLALHHGADEGARGIWYRDAKGRYPVGGLDLDAPGGDADALMAAIGTVLPDGVMPVPRYNSERVLEGLDLYGRAPDGTPLSSDALHAALRRARAALEAEGAATRLVPMQRAEMTRFAGEPGHAATPEAALERSEQILGRRRITPEQVESEQAAKRAAAAERRAAERAGARGGEARAGGDGGEPAAAGTAPAEVGGLGGAPPLDGVDDLDDLLSEDDLLDAGVRLIGPYPTARGGTPASLAQRALTTAGQSLAGSMSGGYLGLGAPAETDEDRRRNALIGATAGLVAGPLVGRAAGRAGGARGTLGTLGAVPGPGDAGDILSRFAGLKGAVSKAQQRAAAIKAAGGNAPSAWDWLKQAGYSGIYGIPTLTTNVLGGAQELLLGQPKEFARSIAEGRGVGGYARQFKAQARAAPDALSGLGKVLFPEGDATALASGGSQGSAGLSERIADPKTYAAARLLERPGEVLAEAPDAIFRPLFTAQGEEREASRIAREMGFTGDKADSYADTLLQSVEALRANPNMRSTSAEARRVLAAGKAYADKLGYKGDPGRFGTWLGKAAKRDDIVGVAASFLMPFPSMAGRMTTAAARSTPGVGLLPRLRKGQSKFDVIYDQAFGAAVAAGVAAYAYQGGITGSGPDDPEKRAEMQAMGWQPNSTMVGGYYVPNRTFGRFQPLLDAVGEIHDGAAYAKKDAQTSERVADAAKRFTKMAADQTGLSGLADLHDLLTQNFASQAPGYAARATTRYVPWAGILRSAAASLDPVNRRPDRWGRETSFGQAYGQSLLQQVPGARGMVPAAQDILGRPAQNPQQGLGAIVPRTTSARDEPLIRAYLDAGVDISSPPGDIEGAALTPDQQRVYRQEMGARLQQLAGPLVASPGWATMPASTRQDLLKQMQQMARELAEIKVRGEGGADFQRQIIDASLKKAAGQ